MASSFSTNLGVEVMASGEKSGAWGDITNLNLNILDRVVSYGVLTASDLTTTLTIRLASPTSGSSNVQTGMFTVILLKDSGSDLGGTNVVTIAPNSSSRFFIIKNSLSGSRSAQIKQGTGTTVTIANGNTDLVFCDGAGSGGAVTSVGDSLQLTNNTAVAGTATALSIALG
tara:strand:+ start:2437 stop:2949 length:513 start_codon:yes stop_codon:yes gene_type:complete